MTETKTYYLRGQKFTPRPGMVVVHNHVMHTPSMPLGFNGFRAWQQVLTGRLAKCHCGWWGIEHFRIRGTSDKCYTPAQIRAAGGIMIGI